MAEITTKCDLGKPGYFMASNKIATATIADIAADDSVANGVKINNTVTMPDGSTQVIDEADIWADPQSLVNDLLAQFEAATVPATTAAAQS